MSYHLLAVVLIWHSLASLGVDYTLSLGSPGPASVAAGSLCYIRNYPTEHYDLGFDLWTRTKAYRPSILFPSV